MSKERELLKEFIDFVDSYEFYPTERSIIWEIVSRAKAILAQPEQTKKEHVGVVRTIGGYPDNSQHTVELTCRHRDLKDGDLLYKAPPKRKPLGLRMGIIDVRRGGG